MPTRRTVLNGLSASAAFLATGCRTSIPRQSRRVLLDQALQDLATRAAGGVPRSPGVALLVRRRGETLYDGAAGYASGLSPQERRQGVPLSPMTTQSKMRVASVSKMAVALTARDVLAKAKLGLGSDVHPWWPGLYNPAFPGTPVTMRHLLSHLSGLRDPDVYWLAAPGRIERLVGQTAFTDEHAPGTYFSYCNLNFGVVATLLERISGTRFDKLAQQTLTSLGISGGFNWSGVPLEERRNGATLYRGENGSWSVQTDGPAVLKSEAPVWLHEDGFALEDYEIGSNGTVFSPQGGLRASIWEMSDLVRAVAASPELASPVWRYRPSAPNGDTLGGLYEAAGLGCFIWPRNRSPIRGHKMIGHDGEAYGLYSGAWVLPDIEADIAFAVTGTPSGEQPPSPTHPGYTLWSQALFDLAANILNI